MNKKDVTRRDFIKKSLQAGGVLLGGTFLACEDSNDWWRLPSGGTSPTEPPPAEPPAPPAGCSPSPLGIELITINAGGDSFIMGDGTYGPNVSQTISYNYSMSKYQITNSRFQAFVDDGGYSDNTYWTTNGWNWKTGNGIIGPVDFVGFTGSNQPRVGVSWYEAVAFCNWLSVKECLTQTYSISGQADLFASGYRLPTEVEWEYAAAKGASGQPERIYAWGDVWDCNKAVSSVAPCNATTTANVGSKSSAGDTPQGLADMSGNVREWCSDNYQVDGSVVGGTDRYNFLNDTTGQPFLVRGGPWSYTLERYFRSSRRGGNFILPSNRVNSIGFRVLRP